MRNDDGWMGAAEAAEHLGLALRTVQIWAATGRLPGYQMGGPGGVWRYKRAELDAWVEAQRVVVLPVESAS